MPDQNIIIIIGVIIVLLYAWYRVSFWKKRLRIETEEAESAVDKSFKDMRKRIEKQIEMLDNTPGLTQEEKEIRDKLEEALNSSEGIIKKEIKDIKKEID